MPSFRAIVLSVKNILNIFNIVDYLFLTRTLSVFFICYIKRAYNKYTTRVTIIKHSYFKYSNLGYSESLYNLFAKYVKRMFKIDCLISIERRLYQETYLCIFITKYFYLRKSDFDRGSHDTTTLARVLRVTSGYFESVAKLAQNSLTKIIFLTN